MTDRHVQLGHRRLGAEILVKLAKQRRSGTLVWATAGAECKLVMHKGRPEAAIYPQGPRVEDREQVRGVVRSFAAINEGACRFVSGEDPAEKRSGELHIDTLAEVLSAMLKDMRPRAVSAFWQSIENSELVATDAFTKFAKAIGGLGGAALSMPESDTNGDALVKSAGEDELRAWLALIVVGAVRVQALPDSNERLAAAAARRVAAKAGGNSGGAAELTDEQKEARAVTVEIKDAHKRVQGTHYEVLGVEARAGSEAIRKAYFAVAKRLHVDRLSLLALPDDILAMAAEIFRASEDAHRVLSDKKERSSYDYILDREAKGLPTDPKVIFEAEGLFTKAEKLVRAGQGAAAEPLLRQAVELNKGEPEFFVYLGYSVYLARGKAGVDEAKKLIMDGLHSRPTMDSGHQFLGSIARAEGDHLAAMRHFKHALRHNTKNIDVQREMRLISKREEHSKREKSALGGLLGKIRNR